jgi:hypothetical protein
MKNSLALLFLLACFTSLAHAADKPHVAVRFKIEASAYRQHFGASVANVENQATQSTIQAFGQHIQFVTFTQPGGQPTPYTLTLSLAVLDPRTDVAAQAVWLIAALAGPNRTLTTNWRKFREAATGCSGLTNDLDCRWPDSPELLRELQVVLGSASLYPSLVSSIFKDVSITNSGKFVVQPLSGLAVMGWVLPFRQEEMCLGTATKLRIVNDIPTDQTTLHGTFHADVEGPYGQPPTAIFTLLSEGEDAAANSLKPLFQQSPDRVMVRGVYLLEYQHLDENCGGAIPPPTAPAAVGGGQ